MALPGENGFEDPFGNDSLFEEFEKPARSEDWDEDIATDLTVSVDTSTGRRHTRFVDDDDGNESTAVEEEEDSSSMSVKSRVSNSSVTGNEHISQTYFNEKSVDPSCCVQVNYLNKKFAKRHRDTINGFITSLIASDRKELEYTSGNDDKFSDKCNFHINFMIDAKGMRVDLPEHSLESSRPVYTQQFRKSLPCDDESDDDEDACPQTKSNQKKSSCWNCDGAHSLHECKEPRDHNRIALNRAAFMAMKDAAVPSLSDSPKMGESRYHADEDPRFANFKPGVVSESLREALGIDQNTLPPYIYNMRKYGYPPGHLLAAKLSASDILMFDKHGQEVGKNGEVMEDGEVDSNAAKGGYNFDKIIEYDGFNVRTNSDSNDCQNPPLNEFQLKSRLPEIFGAGMFRIIDGLERDSKNEKQKTRDELDMDLSEDGIPPQPNTDVISESDANSLTDLEKERESILKTLEDEKTETDKSESTESECGEVESTSNNDDAVTPRMSTRSKSVLINMGTPIGLNSSQVLPDSEKFRSNITEHIPYENLPNATGMFDKMMKVVGKVKDALSSMRK